MSLQDLNKDDWGHRLGVLEAWRHMLSLPLQDRHRTAFYGAVLDGCAITIRALCYGFDVYYNFTKFDDKASDRSAGLGLCLTKSKKSVSSVANNAEEQRCLLEVMFLANRAVAHPTQEKLLPHAVEGGIEMSTAINVVLKALVSRRSQLPLLEPVFKDPPGLFLPLPIDQRHPATAGKATPWIQNKK